jgi:hypothetical protein
VDPVDVVLEREVVPAAASRVPDEDRSTKGPWLDRRQRLVDHHRNLEGTGHVRLVAAARQSDAAPRGALWRT